MWISAKDTVYRTAVDHPSATDVGGLRMELMESFEQNCLTDPALTSVLESHTDSSYFLGGSVKVTIPRHRQKLELLGKCIAFGLVNNALCVRLHPALLYQALVGTTKMPSFAFVERMKPWLDKPITEEGEDLSAGLINNSRRTYLMYLGALEDDLESESSLIFRSYLQRNVCERPQVHAILHVAVMNALPNSDELKEVSLECEAQQHE